MRKLRVVLDYWFFRISLLLFILMAAFISVAYLLPRLLPAQKIANSSVSGIIVRNQIWEGTIRVVGDTIFAPGARVEIKPGTKILISKEDDRFNLDFNPRHFNKGINIDADDHGVKRGEPYWNEADKVQLRFAKVSAHGIAEQPIEITSEDSSRGSPYDINLITASQGEFIRVRFSNYRRLEIGPDVAILDSEFSNTGDCAVCISYGTPTVGENIFKNGRRVYINAELASPKIENNDFLESEGDGLLFSGDKYANVRVVNNFFNMPKKLAVKVLPIDEGGVMSRNYFLAGDIELPCDSKVTIAGNWIREKVVFNNPSCSGTYTFGSNYWELEDIKSVLQTRILGTTNKFKAEIPFILDKPPAGIQTR